MSKTRRLMPSRAIRPSVLILALVIAMPLAAQTSVAQPDAPSQNTPAQLWEDFGHYVLIARPDLALASGTKLLSQVNDDQLLSIVEASDYEHSSLLERAGRIETLAEIAGELARRIQAARIERSRDSTRIQNDIQNLAGTDRQRQNATQRLRAAGQFAAPQLLATLLDDTRSDVHPYVLAAMVEIGRPMVYPLSVALEDLETVPQARIAQVLSQIGYPRALPYLRAVLESKSEDDTSRLVIQRAYEQLAATIAAPSNIRASELFLQLAHNYYQAGTLGTALPGLDTTVNKGIIWAYTPEAGLFPIPVPGAIFPDVLALRAARRALELDREMSPALSMMIIANLRRENRLPAGEVDPSYPKDMLPAAFYAEMAGPLRLHDVLATALRDNDTALALDAIAALQTTAGLKSLLNEQGTGQPLLTALSYPDRRVRFNAAMTLARSLPDEAFEGSYRVVPVLGEAVRQSDQRQALVVSDSLEKQNALLAALRDLDYAASAGPSLDALADAINIGPGVDVIIAAVTAPQAVELFNQTTNNYKLAAAPVLVLASPGDVTELNRRYDQQPRISAMIETNETDKLDKAINDMVNTMVGDPIGEDEAATFALSALDLLERIALSRTPAYRIEDALPALLGALGDPRDEIVQRSGQVLALINDVSAQQAIATVALDEAADYDTRVSLLNSLADSAKRFGNQTLAAQVDQLHELVMNSRGELAIAAARAHGAMNLPTSNVVDKLLQE